MKALLSYLLLLITCDPCIPNTVYDDTPSSKQVKPSSHLLSTGTTIVGICCKDGIILGADTRATGGLIVMDKNKQKIHKISNTIFCCGAGMAAHCEHICRRGRFSVGEYLIKSGLMTDAFVPVSVGVKSIVASMIGLNCESVFIVGGLDQDDTPVLYQITSEGFPSQVGFTALGSGSIDALMVLESAKVEWDRNNTSSLPQNNVHTLRNTFEELDISNQNFLSRFFENVLVDDAIETVRKAVRAGIMNDLGSGSHIDLCIIRPKNQYKGGSVEMNAQIWREHGIYGVENETFELPLKLKCDDDISETNEVNIDNLGIKIIKHKEKIKSKLFSGNKLFHTVVKADHQITKEFDSIDYEGVYEDVSDLSFEIEML